MAHAVEWSQDRRESGSSVESTIPPTQPDASASETVEPKAAESSASETETPASARAATLPALSYYVLPPAPARKEIPYKPKKWEYMWFCFLFFGILSYFILSLFIRHIQIKEDVDQAPTRRVQDLVNLLTQAETKQKQLEKEVTKLRRRLIDLQQPATTATATPATPEQVEQANPTEYQKLLKISGLTPVNGPGIVISLDNPADPMQPEKGRTATAVQNNLQSEDLLRLVNDLKAAGATAISINGQRIVTTTEIVNSGASIVVNQTRIAPPIQIRAVGSSDVLRASLSIRGGILEYLAFFGIKAQIQDKPNVKVPAFNGSI
jgi:uncharacterized protein YlxW (UPF0749 family)